MSKKGDSPISVQHPLAVSEIVAWDGMYILLIAENDESVNTFMKKIYSQRIWKSIIEN